MKKKYCFKHLFPCTTCTSAILYMQSLVAPHSRRCERLGTKFCSRSLAKNGDRLNESLSRETIFLAKTLHVHNKLVRLKTDFTFLVQFNYVYVQASNIGRARVCIFVRTTHGKTKPDIMLPKCIYCTQTQPAM